MSYEKTGVERVAEEAASRASSTTAFTSARSIAQPAAAAKPAQPSEWDVEVGRRADSDHKSKTTMPKIAGGYKLPSSSLLQRPDEQQAVDAEELKLLARSEER